MWNRHAMAKARGAQALAGKQLSVIRARDRPCWLSNKTGFFKGTLFAGGINAHENLSGRQDGAESVHGGVGHYAHGA